MTFQTAIQTCQELANAYHPGLQAMGGNSQVVECAVPRRIVGSIDLDTTLRTSYPDAARWDYGVGVQNGQAHKVIWIEVHPASTGEVQTVLNKLTWLKSWLQSSSAELRQMTSQSSYHWAATEAGVHINPNSAQAKRLALSGLNFPRRRINICK